MGNGTLWVRWGFLAQATLLVCAGTGCGRERADGPLVLSGNIEATVVQASFKVAGRVVDRPVDEGQPVKAGDLLARLDDSEFAGEAARIEAQVAGARAQWEELASGFRPEEVAQARAALDAADADAVRTASDLARQKVLLEREVISQREFESSKGAADAAAARRRQAREALTLLERGSRVEKVEAAKASLEQAEASLALARIRLAETRLFSPLGGRVLSKAAEVGEFLSPGSPVVTVADLSRVWLRAFVPETSLGKVKLGQAARVTTDSFPGKVYPGRVSYISPEAEFTPKSVQTDKERVRLVYRVKIDLDNPAGELKPGMPADGEIKD